MDITSSYLCLSKDPVELWCLLLRLVNNFWAVQHSSVLGITLPSGWFIGSDAVGSYEEEENGGWGIKVY
jgi:hypothetical protein